MAGLAVTALISLLVVRHYSVAPPWRALLVVASLAAIPGLVVIYAWAMLAPAFGLFVVVLLLLSTVVWVGRDR